MKLEISKALFLRLQKALKTDEAIGERFGATRQAVHLFRKRYGIAPVRDRHAKRNARIFRMYLREFSSGAISAKTGLSANQVLKIVRKSYQENTQ